MEERKYESYDYMKITVDEALASKYMDGYLSFGWCQDENMKPERAMGKVTIHFKRSRSIINKVELTRLQRHFEACMQEIETLDNSKHSIPTIGALSCGILGCAFMAGSVFAVTAVTPIIWLMIVLAIPGFALWGGAYFCHRALKHRQTKKVTPLIEAKYDEMDEVCKKAQVLLI